MAEILKVLDIYVLSSLWEGLPMVLLEAMASGFPIVATDVGGNRSAIRHGVNGSFIPAKSAEHLAAEIVHLLSNEETRVSYVRNGLETVRGEFSAATMTRKYERLYLRDM